MATVSDLESQAQSAVGGTVGGVLVAWSAPTVVSRGNASSRVRVASSSVVNPGSNASARVAEVVAEVAVRASGTTSANLDSAEASALAHLSTLTAISYWTALAAVRSSPLPEVDVESDLERIGEVITFTVRARVVLEA